MTNVTLKMFGFLVLYQYLFVVEFTIAVPAPGLHLLLLFAAHFAGQVCPLLANEKKGVWPFQI